MYQVFGIAIAPHIDKNGLPHTARMLVTADMRALLDWATPQVVDLMDQIFGGEHEDVNVAAAIAYQLHELDSEDVFDLFELMELETPEDNDQPTLVYLGIGTDDDDLEDKFIAKVGEIDQDNEDDLDESFDEDDD